MDTTAYIPFILLGLFMSFLTLLTGSIFYLLQKKDHKESARELKEYLHRWQIESDQNDKNAQRILDEIQKTNRGLQEINKENSIFLRMIFERVDRPPQSG